MRLEHDFGHKIRLRHKLIKSTTLTPLIYNGNGVNHVKRLRPKKKKEKISLNQLRRSYMTPLIIQNHL
jgi:hypothetical protein